MRLHNFFVFLLLLIIVGCSPTTIDSIDNKNDANDILKLNKENESIEVLHHMEFLTKESSPTGLEYDSFNAFIPNEKYLGIEKITNEDFKFIKLKENDSLISGKLKFENNTNKNMNINNLFLQGNKSAKIRLSNSKEWSSSILNEVPAKSSINIYIDIKWDSEGMNELTFFPINIDETHDRYNGVNISSFRYYVQNKDIVVKNTEIERQSFKLKDDNEENMFPTPSWVDKNKKEIDYLSKNKISGLKLEKIDYDTSVDAILLDEFGNTEILSKNIQVKKNQNTYIYINKSIIEDMYGDEHRKFIIVSNNRGNELFIDLKTLDKNMKPFSTSFQGVLEFYPVSKNN